MIISLNEATQRKAATEVIINLINELSEKNGNVEKIIVLKSCLFISIYNSIEALAYICLEAIHEECRSVGFKNLTEKIQEISIKYHLNSTRQDIEKETKRLELIATNEKIPSLSDYIKRKPIFSGNIDLRKINRTFTSYGIDEVILSKSESEAILWIKTKRNKIAHGEQTMFDAGQGIKTNKLIFANDAANKLLLSMTENCNEFIRSCRYKEPEGASSETVKAGDRQIA